VVLQRFGVGLAVMLLACLRTDGKRYACALRVVPLSLYWVLLFVAVTCTGSRADTFTSLVNFVGPTDGISSYASIIQASDGNLYGTTAGGGPYELGTIFK